MVVKFYFEIISFLSIILASSRLALVNKLDTRIKFAKTILRKILGRILEFLNL